MDGWLGPLFKGEETLEGDGAGGVTELGLDQPGPGEVDKGAAVSFVVMSLE